MKNYLGNLIARHLNQAEVLQPRLASRFEPQTNTLQAEPLQPDISEGEAGGPDTEFSASEVTLAPQRDNAVERPPVQAKPTVTTFESVAPRPVIQNTDATPLLQPQRLQPAISVSPPPVDAAPISAESTAPAFVLHQPREQPTALPAPDPSPSAKEPQRTSAVAAVALTDDLTEDVLPASSPAPVTKKNSQRVATTKPVVVTKPAPLLAPSPSSRVDFQTQVPTTNAASSSVSHIQNKLSSLPVANSPHTEIQRRLEPARRQNVEIPAASESSSPVVLPATVAPAAEPVKVSAVITSETESHISSKQSVGFSEEVRPPLQTERAPALETSVVSAQRNDQVNARRHFVDEVASVDNGPTVNVTIGRIEVRATAKPPEAQPQKQRREHQVLSLDEYLSQRSAGGR